VNASKNVPFGSAYGVEDIGAQEALRDASIVVLDEALAAFSELWHQSEVEDLAQHHADPAAKAAFEKQAKIEFDPFVISSRLPSIYKSRYGSFDFLKNWILTLTVVGWKLAQPEPRPLTNVAEELAMHALISDALGRAEELDPRSPEAERSLQDLYDRAFEDNDFLELYRLQDSDDIPDIDPSGLMGMTDLRFKSWFQPFGSGVDRGVPHPFLLDG
jgi:hypothetical protein